jgi:hypothetical protein
MVTTKRLSGVKADLSLSQAVNGGNILQPGRVSFFERFDVQRSISRSGDLGFVIPMPRYVCPGGSRSLRGLFLSSHLAPNA